jgi:hypothetical protein
MHSKQTLLITKLILESVHTEMTMANHGFLVVSDKLRKESLLVMVIMSMPQSVESLPMSKRP